MKNKKVILLCALLFLLVNFSYAFEDSNVDLKTNENIKIICPCSLVKYQLELSNTGNFSENYIIDVIGKFKKWSKLTVEKITLAPGQKTILDFYVRPGCDVYGNYSSLFKVTTEKTNLAAKMPLYLYILPCYDYNITLGDYYTIKEEVFLFKKHYGDYKLCEKEEKVIPVLIENKAPIPNRYDLKFKGKGWAELDKKRVIINAKNSSIVDLIIKPPERLRGNYTFLLEAETYWGDLKQKKEFNVSVDWCYTPFIKTGRVNANYTKLTKQIEIQNLGSKEADYSFEVIEKPDWVKVKPLNITILPNETRTINLISEPSEEIKQGYSNLIINTTIVQNGVGYENIIIIKLAKKGIFNEAYEKTKELVKNYIWYFLSGIAGLIVLLVVLSLIRKTIIKRKEIKKIKEKEPEIKEKVKKEKPEKIIKKPKIKLRKYFVAFIIILLIVLAFNYSLLPELFKGNFTAITLYPGKYPLEEEINITEVPAEELEPEILNITAKPKLNLTGIKERTYAYGKCFAKFLKPYSYYIGFGILALIFLIILIRFLRKKKVEKEVKKKEIDFYPILKILLWMFLIALLVFAISYLRNYILFFIWYILGGILAFAVLIFIIKILKNKKIKKHFKKKWKSYFLILILILFLFGVYFSYQNKYYEKPYNKTKAWISEINSKLKNITYAPIENVTEEVKEEELEEVEEEIVEEEPEEVEEKEIIISWKQNSNCELDLKQYFHDPDSDKLYFSSKQLKNIDVEIDVEGIATLKPRENWYGKEKIVFTADDDKGGVVKSGEITLVVKEVSGKPFLEKIKSINLITKIKNFLSVYSVYIISGLVILVIALLLLKYTEKKNKSKKRKSKKNKRKKS